MSTINIRDAVTKPAGEALGGTLLYQGNLPTQDAVIEMGEKLVAQFPGLKIHQAAMNGGGTKPTGERNVPLALIGKVGKLSAVFTFYVTKRDEAKLVVTNASLPEDLLGEWAQA